MRLSIGSEIGDLEWRWTAWWPPTRVISVCGSWVLVSNIFICF